MKKGQSHSSKFKELRKKAEEILKSKSSDLDKIPAKGLKEQIYELNVHQIELELQNNELRKAQEEIEESRQKFSDLYNFAPVGYLTFDKNGQMVEINHTFSIQIGVEKKLLMNKNFAHYIAKEDQDNFYFFRNRIFESKNMETCEIRLKSKANDIFYAQLDGSFVTDSNGNGFCKTTVIDVTKHRQAEKALRKSEASLTEAQRIAHMGNCDWDIVNNKFHWSKEVYRIFGVTAENFGNNYKAYMNLVHPDDKEFVKKSINEALYKNKPYSIDYRITRPDGTERIVHNQAEITFDDAGNPIRMFGTVHDITEHKKIEKELLRAQKLESIGVFAGGIAHDFNNILTAILGYATLAKMSVRPDEKLYENLVKVENASLSAKDLTNQLLTFSKGGVPIKKTTSISELIRDSVEFALRGSHARCEFSIPHNLWPVEVDEGQMNQVINNLIINAVQAMSAGGIIKVCAENMTVDDSKKIIPLKPGRHVRIYVKDQGIGILPELLPKIFDPYFTTKKEGSGLGLASSYSIIKNHVGLITAESEINVGTTFYIYLPASSKKIIKKNKKVEESLTGKGKILVMDDEYTIRDMADRMLTYIGYEVECAKDGTEAIEIYKKAKKINKPFDVVIMDLTIPGGMGGKHAIKKLHKIDSKAKTIVFSGYSNDPIMANFGKYGFKGVITKPFKLRELNDLLHKVIEKR